MNRFRQALLLGFCFAMIFSSVWVPLRGKDLRSGLNIVSYHWIWNTGLIYWKNISAIPTQIEYSRLIVLYVAIFMSFALLYVICCIFKRQRFLATQSEIEQNISSENLKCPACNSEPMVGVDGKKKEVFLLCPKCETEWYLKRQSIDETMETLRSCLSEYQERPESLKAKCIIKKQRQISGDRIGDSQ